nr:7122_t:CDS:10 [Entrophospora candida]
MEKLELVTARRPTPYLSHIPLACSTHFIEWVPGCTRILFARTGWGSLRTKSYSDHPTNIPLPFPKEVFGVEDNIIVEGFSVLSNQSNPSDNVDTKDYLCTSDFRQAYLSKKTTPLQVCEALIKRIEESNPLINAVSIINKEDVIEQAKKSTARYEDERPLGLLDGIPVLVKDEFDVIGYETKVGTTFINDGNVCDKDATVIHNLRKLGAIIVGKTIMHEIGLGITSNNPSSLTPRNPHNPDYYCGGSSGGSACVVAAGLTPIAIGCDGGGSIRVPSSFCGIYGLKPTCGRNSNAGEFPLCWTVAVSGPMAICIDDLALAYYAMAGRDEDDPFTYLQPAPTLYNLNQTKDLSDLKIGIYSAWNKQVYNKSITISLDNLINQLKERGANFVEIVIPELKDVQAAHLVNIFAEHYTSMKNYKDELYKLSYPSRFTLAILEQITGRDYIQAQQVRTRSMKNLATLFNEVDLILTPVSSVTAPKIHPRALKFGEVDSVVATDVIHFLQLANFTGIPAITVPGGYDDNGLPIGLQFMAKWYKEDLLLRIGKASEEIFKDSRRKPKDGYWFGDLI